MDNSRNEEAFRAIASKATQSSKRRFDDGEMHLEKSKEENNEIEEQEFLNAAGEEYGFATEIALKSNLIYDDFSKNERFNQEQTGTIQYEGKDVCCYGIGTPEWRKSLAADDRNLKILNDPKEIKKLIEHNNPNDIRKIITTSESPINPNFKSLRFDNEQGKISGHVLYPYFQLQNDKAKNLINTEYYCDVEDEEKYTIYALLTEDILEKENSGKTIMPRDMMENMVALKEPAIALRYSSISGKDIMSDDLSFLRTFSHSVINANEHRFPLPKIYDILDFEKYNYQKFNHRGFRFFDGLDRMQKYYLQSCFTNEEIESMMNYINLLSQTKNNLDIELFLNNCIYFKDYIVNRMKIKLTFTEKQFARIDRFCDLIKAFQPFDPNSKRLCDNEAFDTKEKIVYYKNKIKKKQEEKAIDNNIEELNEKELKPLFFINEKNIIPEKNIYRIIGLPQIRAILSKYTRGESLPFDAKLRRLENYKDILVYPYKDYRVLFKKISITEEEKEKLKERYKDYDLDNVYQIGVIRRYYMEEDLKGFNKYIKETMEVLEIDAEENKESKTK